MNCQAIFFISATHCIDINYMRPIITSGRTSTNFQFKKNMKNRSLAAQQEALEQTLSKMVNARPERVIQAISDLVRIPSENTPPIGTEIECQRYVHDRFLQLDLKTEIYEL